MTAQRKKEQSSKSVLLKFLLAILILMLILEIGLRIFVERPLKADFYGSISRDEVGMLQDTYGVQPAEGPGWAHLGWVADPENESYRIEFQTNGTWQVVGEAEYGSYLISTLAGEYRVWAVPKNGSDETLLGSVEVRVPPGGETRYRPVIDGDWQTLFRPVEHGFYVNDHTIFQDVNGDWRLVGITDKSDGNYNEEKYFTVGVSSTFPPVGVMMEEAPVADYGEQAWAPHVIRTNDGYHMFWSPHKLHQADSVDGIRWENHRITMEAPYHKFFRDPFVLQVAENQWLLYTTARGRYFSLVDIYQSFNLEDWQYIRSALRSGWGSERNSPFASMESPNITEYEGRYYLMFTYNNDSFFPHGLLLAFKIWLNRDSYNDTLVFTAGNPYDFGEYRGRDDTEAWVTSLEAHGPEVVFNPETDRWYLTTAGWPWVATLTGGEAAVAPLRWEPLP